MRNPKEVLVLLTASRSSGKIATAEITIKSYCCILRLYEALCHSLGVDMTDVQLIWVSQREVLRINLQLILSSALFHRLELLLDLRDRLLLLSTLILFAPLLEVTLFHIEDGFFEFWDLLLVGLDLLLVVLERVLLHMERGIFREWSCTVGPISIHSCIACLTLRVVLQLLLVNVLVALPPLRAKV